MIFVLYIIVCDNLFNVILFFGIMMIVFKFVFVVYVVVDVDVFLVEVYIIIFLFCFFVFVIVIIILWFLNEFVGLVFLYFIYKFMFSILDIFL